jgi:lipopolysaccharide export system ATP-binding protein
MKLFSFGSKAAAKSQTRKAASQPVDDYVDDQQYDEQQGYDQHDAYLHDDRGVSYPPGPAGSFPAASSGQSLPQTAHVQNFDQTSGQTWYPDERLPPQHQNQLYQTPPQQLYRQPDPASYQPPPHQAYTDAFDAHAEPEAGENFLTAYNVQKTYGQRKVVKGVSLSVRRGQSVGLLGPNGAGKTTVFYMITGLVAADEGRITIDGRDVTRMPMYRRARLGIGYLPQEASIFRGLSVEQNIMAVLELVEPNRKKRKEQLDSLLEEFKITRLRKSPSIALSGGERRRCEIARALASRPSFMLLDEPFAGIDPLAVGDIQDLVRHLTQRGIGVLITDHNVRETLSLIDRAYIIYDGQVLTHGNPDEIINNEDVRRVYLGDMFG